MVMGKHLISLQFYCTNRVVSEGAGMVMVGGSMEGCRTVSVNKIAVPIQEHIHTLVPIIATSRWFDTV